MYAIIVTGGKQYKVSEGDFIKVEKLDAEPGETVTFDKVVALSVKKLKVGKEAAKASVTATVTEHGRGKKIIVYKFKSKTGYNKKQGHRQAYTKVRIDKINTK
ncbi:MAG: 50S ribosomal protein L21 [Lachnospiraceae bacterium]|jgi:large subunit ribosomal protein L21|nr:50S ribosomal protein L21 [Lachnospiraceae bacterium]